MNLVIVESPIKSKSIKSILVHLGVDKDYDIVGTAGHICNLDDKELGVFLEKGKFRAEFKLLENKKNIVDLIKNKLKYMKAEKDKVFICTDDDREGERIAEDVVAVCKIKNYFRVTFREITIEAIKKALVEKDGIRLIDENIVKAQWTRRVIDRIIGYGLSPAISFYYKKQNKIFLKDENSIAHQLLPKGTGRVIGIALNLIAKRQKSIDLYNEEGAKTSYVIVANYKYDDYVFSAIGNKLEFKEEEIEQRDKIINSLNYKIHRVYSKTKELSATPPPSALSTQALLISASFLYELLPVKTEKIAKDLFETGYINYPRTDTINLATSVSKIITDYLLAITVDEKKADILLKPRVYKEKKDNTQNSHEAIRPSIFSKENISISDIKNYSPENIRNIWANNPLTKHFDNYHYLIYELIWVRTVCTQFKDSEYDVSKIEIKVGDYTFEAKSNDRVFDGWEQYYGDLIRSSILTGEENTKRRTVIPNNIVINTILEDFEVTYYEKKSKTPKRISEGGLIKLLSSLNIARPSTLSTYSNALVKKDYIKSIKTLLIPTDLGLTVNEFTENYIPWLIDEKKAKEFEKTITQIELGKLKDTDGLIKEYWDLVNELRKEVVYPLLIES